MSRISRGFFLIGLAGAAVLQFWVFRRTFNLLDEGVMLVYADEIARGRVPYRDFFCQYPPLSFLVLAAWGGVAPGLLAARSLVLAAHGFVALSVYRLTRAASDPRFAVPAAAAYLAGFATFNEFVYYNPIALALGAAAACAILLDRAPLRAGLLLGLAAGVKHHTGLCFLLAAITGTGRDPRSLARLGAGFAAPLLVLWTWLGAAGALGRAWEDLVMYNVRWGGAIAASSVGIPSPAGYFAPLARLAEGLVSGDVYRIESSLVGIEVAASPCLALFALAGRGADAGRDRLALGLAAFSLMGAVNLYPLFDEFHALFVYPFVFPLLARACAVAPWRAAAGGSAAAGFLLFHIARGIAIFDGYTEPIPGPRGVGVFVRAEETKTYLRGEAFVKGIRAEGGTVFFLPPLIGLQYLYELPLPSRSTHLTAWASSEAMVEGYLRPLEEARVEGLVLPSPGSKYSLEGFQTAQRFLSAYEASDTTRAAAPNWAGQVFWKRKRP